MNDPALNYIKHVLETRNWSASRLAEEAGLSPSTINRPLAQPDWPHQISRRTIEKVFDASKVDPSAFGFGDFGSSALKGMSEPSPSTLAGRILENMANPNPDTTPSDAMSTDIKIGVHGRFAQVIATVDKAGLAALRRKLDAIEALLDD